MASREKVQKDSWSSLWKLKPYIRPYYWMIGLALLLGIPLATIRASLPYIIQNFVDDVLVNQRPDRLVFYPAVIVGLYLLNFPVRYFHYYLLRVVIARVNQKLKHNIYKKLMSLSADHFTEAKTGDLISRVGNDPQYVDGGISCINILLREPLTFLMLFSYSCYLNWQLTLLILAIFPALAWLFSFSGKHLKRYIQKMAQENGEIFAYLQEHFSGVRVIKLFRLENYAQKKFAERVDQYTNISLKTARVQEASHPGVELFTSFAIAAVAYFGGFYAVNAQMTVGQFTAFMAAFALMKDPIQRLNDVNIKISQAAGACKRIFSIFEWKDKVIETPNALPITHFDQEIVFDQVDFFYPAAPDRKVLNQVSFSLKKGKTLAIVGESGAGKSSLVHLLPRIYDITSGSIRVDGHDIRNLKVADLRALIAVVSQDVFLFNDTVKENIRCGRLDATPEEIQKAAEQAFALEFIQNLPNQFQTLIGDRGQKLSGGERQRLSIARAFLRKAPILILDEATSSLDSASEKMVQNALDRLMENRTTILIAHRLSTVQGADEIIVLKKGEMIEQGRHEELIRRDGEYARFQKLGSAQSVLI